MSRSMVVTSFPVYVTFLLSVREKTENLTVSQRWF